jgi:hypothetical protein
MGLRKPGCCRRAKLRRLLPRNRRRVVRRRLPQPLQDRRTTALESAAMHETLSMRDRLTFDEYVYLTDKLRRAERLRPHELRALERHEAVERTGGQDGVEPDSHRMLTESS